MRISKSKSKAPDWETAVVQRWNDDFSTGVPYWDVWYKGVQFGEFGTLAKASERLQKLMDLDTSREDNKIRKRLTIREETATDE